MSTRNFLSITAELKGGVAQFRIVDTISEDGLASSAVIRSQVDSFLNQGVRTAELFISSNGGDCFEAEDIATELNRFGKENVLIRVGARAASAVTFLTSKFKTIATPNSQFMFHRPRLQTYGDFESMENDIKLLKNVTANYVKAYSEKSGKSIQEIEAMLSKGDVWMSAEQALKERFIDGIEDIQGSNGSLSAFHSHPAKLAASLSAQSSWKFEDYVRAGEFLNLERTNPQLAAKLESEHYSQLNTNSKTKQLVLLAQMGATPGKTFEDYLQNDREAWYQMQEKYPKIAEELINTYQGR